MHSSSCTAMNEFSFAKCKLCVTNCVMFVGEKKFVLEINKKGRENQWGKIHYFLTNLFFFKVGYVGRDTSTIEEIFFVVVM